MIEPNFNLLLWIILLSGIVGALSRIIAGLLRAEKSNRYGNVDIFSGIVEIILLAWVMTT